VRNHKLFLGDYEHQCGVSSKQQDAMVEHQQQMKGALYDVVDPFDAFEHWFASRHVNQLQATKDDSDRKPQPEYRKREDCHPCQDAV
jgi:hypothetical protein